MIQRHVHSKTDSTIQATNRIQGQFHSEMESTIKPTNRIQGQFYSKTDSTIKLNKEDSMSVLFKDRFNH